MERTFEYNDAVRKQVPLLLGLVSASGGGKTTSALRLATGIQRVTGGDIACIDTESNRALHYADQFKFRHVPFGAPFSPLDYLQAIEWCVSKGAKTLIVDSMSHEHEGPGGVLEWHQSEMDRMSDGDDKRAKKFQMLAWAKLKSARRRMINTILQLPINCIFCFRAKEKLKVVPGKEPEELDWMAIAGEEFIYEMTASMLLYPKGGGVPVWESSLPGERATMKLPRQFAGLFQQSVPLSEDIGQQMAEWAAGDAVGLSDLAQTFVDGFEIADAATFKTIGAAMRRDWAKLTRSDQAAVKAAHAAAKDRLASEPPADDERGAIQGETAA